MKDYSKDKNYISKSKITRTELNKMGIPKYISVEEVKDNFDQLDGRSEKVGNPYNYQQQRFTKYVHKKELYDFTIKGRSQKYKRK